MHNPERQQNESQQQYRERRAASRLIAHQIASGIPNRGRVVTRTNESKRPSSTDRERARTKAERAPLMQPKFPAERKHKPHHHELRDAVGAYTLVGRPRGYGVIDTSNLPQMGRRIWLAGISAQRGF